MVMTEMMADEEECQAWVLVVISIGRGEDDDTTIRRC